MAISIDRRRYPARFALLLLAPIATFYVLTLSHGIQAGDGPELTTAAYRLGVPHPSGYPLYTLTGRLFSLVPLGSIAFRMNLFSALCGAAAAALLGGFLRREGASAVGAAFAAAALATSSALWRESASAEVYTLSLLFLALLLAVSPERRGETRRVFLFSFLAGLALTNHLSLVFLLPVLALRAVFAAGVSRWTAVSSALFFLLGLTPYLYLPVRASLDPLWNWGDPSTLDRFVAHVTGYGYWGYLGEGNTVGRFLSWLGGLGTKLTWGVYLLVPAGVVAMRRSHRPLLILVAGGTLLSLGYTLHFQINDPAAYFLPVYMLLATAIAFSTRFIPTKTAAPLFAVLIVVQAAQNAHSCDLHDRGVMDEYINNLLMTLDEGAALVAEGDSDTFGLLYALHAERRRPDITVWNAVLDLMPDGPLFEDLPTAGGRTRAKRERLRARLRSGGAVYAVSDRDELGLATFELVPYGLLYRYVRIGAAVGARRSGIWKEYHVGEARKVPRDGGYLERILAATYPLQESRLRLAEGKEEDAYTLLRKTEEMGDGLSVVLNNVGLAWYRAGRNDEARRLYTKAAAIARDGLPRLNLAYLSLEEGKVDEAKEHFRWVISHDPRLRYDALFALGRLLTAGGDRAEGERMLRAAAEERPYETAPLVELARSRVDEGRYGEARILFAKADRLAPGERRAGEFSIAAALEAGGETGEAADIYAALTGNPPADGDALEALALLRAGQGRDEEADSLFEILVGFDRNDPSRLNSYAWSLAERNRNLPRALDLARRAADLAPSDPYIADTHGWVLYRLGRCDEAVESLRDAMRLGYRGEGARYRLGLALVCAGKSDEGLALLRSALEADPESPHATEARRLLGGEG